jgi:hypothetical protein
MKKIRDDEQVYPFPIARGAQEQVATFFETDGQVIIQPEPARFFEVPRSKDHYRRT